MKGDHYYLFHTDIALLSISLRSSTFDAFCDAGYPTEYKIKRLGLKWKTDSLIKHDRLLNMRDKMYELV